MDDPSTAGVTEGFGLMFYQSRFYDPALGRFTSADSIVPAGVQGWDRYAYVRNSPVRYNDPTGHNEDCGIGEACRFGHNNPNDKPYIGGSPKIVIPKDLTLNTSSKPASVNDSIYSEFISPLADAVCNELFSGIVSGSCNNGAFLPALPPLSGGTTLPSLIDIYCNGGSGFACAATVTQDIATAIDAVGVAWIEAPLFAAGCSLGGPGGCIAGEGAAAWFWFGTGNFGETFFSVASLGFTGTDDFNNYGFNFVRWENTYTSAGTVLAGSLPLTPSWDLAVDTYGSAYNHGAVNGLDVILSGGTILK